MYNMPANHPAVIGIARLVRVTEANSAGDILAGRLPETPDEEATPKLLIVLEVLSINPLSL